MRVLVLGRQGQLARALIACSAAKPSVEMLALGRPELNLELSGSVESAVRSVTPDVVINAAAYTAVDEAEDEPERAFRINADAAAEAATAARNSRVPIIHLSTDYVFDGTAKGPYREDSETNPLGTYGRSKLEGEERVRAANEEHLIIRTAWVYSPWGRNFVKTMLRLAADRQEVDVVADQFGSPTSAIDLAHAILHVLSVWNGSDRTGLGETYHVAGQGKCSWAELAEEVFRISGSLGGPTATVRAIASSEFLAKAKRPSNSLLDSSKFQRSFAITMPHWRTSLANVMRLVPQH